MASTAQSLLRQPAKVTKADFPVQSIHDSKENEPSLINKLQELDSQQGVKRKKTEAELREALNQRKMLNATVSGDSGLTTAALSTTSKRAKTDLNQTIDATSAANLKKRTITVTKPSTATTTRSGLSSTLSRTKSAANLKSSTLSSTTKASASTVSKTSTTSKASSKRPAWDIKGRLEDMEKETAVLRNELREQMNRTTNLSSQLQERETQVHEIVEDKTALQSNIEGHRRELQQVYMEKLDLQKQLIEQQEAHNSQAQEMLFKQRSLETMLQSCQSSLSMARAESENLKITIETQKGQIMSLQAEVEQLRTKLSSSEQLNADRKKKIEDLEMKIDQDAQTIAGLEAEIREDEALRKKLHNTIQELKGNIRVYCRVRPFIGGESAEENGESAAFEFSPHNDRNLDIITSQSSGITGTKSEKKFPFSFDKVFKPDSSQELVFKEISQLVQSSLDGYNTCIFAYGQTGSGKTYTMEGPGIDTEIDMPIVDTEKRGMIPRAVEQIFHSATQLGDKGWTYEMEVMYIEIYNESIRDLLATGKIKEDTKYEIKHDSKGTTTVTNVNTIKVRNPNQVFELLKRAAKNRAVSKTNMNEQSSRSHSVFQMKLSGLNTISNEKTNGILNLIDLAGSERLDRSGVTGQHLKETQNINKSLSCLGDVIAALANKDSHVPYRNSKLTYLLQNSLGGNSKTLMFVNISPRPSDLNETMSSLRFATKVNACEIGTAKSQKKVDLKL